MIGSVTEQTRFAGYPERIRYGTAHPDVVYVRLAGWYAVHGTVDDGAATVLQDDAGEQVVVLEGEPPDDAAAIPVYAMEGGGPPAVPTGLVFVRFADGLEAASYRGTFLHAGYEIVKTLAYAPNAVWIRAASGQLAQALANLRIIETFPGVENIEPQFLIEAQRRGRFGSHMPEGRKSL